MGQDNDKLTQGWALLVLLGYGLAPIVVPGALLWLAYKAGKRR